MKKRKKRSKILFKWEGNKVCMKKKKQGGKKEDKMKDEGIKEQIKKMINKEKKEKRMIWRV